MQRTRTAKTGSKAEAGRAAKAEKINQITEQLAAGIQALSGTDAWRRYLDFQATLPTFSFGNTMLIMMQCPEATMVMAYGKPEKPGTWMHIGRHARAGEKALYIRKPAFKKIAAEDTADGRERTELRFVWVPVFDVSQTEGDPVPDHICQLLDGEDPEGVLGQAVTFIESRGYHTEFVPEIGGSQANGDCTYALKRIRVCTSGRTPLQQAKTALHEAAHMLLHEGSTLDRGLIELEAESVAYVAAQYMGLETGEYSFGYVTGWAGHSAKKAQELIKESGTRIQTAAKTILEGMGAIEARDFSSPDAPAGESPAHEEAVAA